MWWTVRLTILLLLTKFSTGRMDCSKVGYDKCVRLADPLVKEAHLVFPDNINDIDQVCTTWNQFVDCLKIYTDECFTDQQRKQFNRAVESPIESVHQMCTQPSYQKEYLLYAPCIKNTIIQTIHCGPQYNLLVDQVDQGDIISKSTLCCSHDRFKQCVQRETRSLCDRGIHDGPATKFATHIIDKALRFLQDQCINYIPNSGDCQINPTDILPYSDRADILTISTSSSEVYPWSTVQQEKHPKELPASVMTPPKISTPFPWSSSTIGRDDNLQTDRFSTQMLGSRSRPASYGRASSWADSNPPQAGNTIQMYPDLPSTVSPRTNWATMPSWSGSRVLATTPGLRSTQNNDKPYSPTWNIPAETTMWYPAAGNQLTNEVDEPNQLGLKKMRNSASNNEKVILLSIVLFLISLYYF